MSDVPEPLTPEKIVAENSWIYEQKLVPGSPEEIKAWFLRVAKEMCPTLQLLADNGFNYEAIADTHGTIFFQCEKDDYSVQIHTPKNPQLPRHSNSIPVAKLKDAVGELLQSLDTAANRPGMHVTRKSGKFIQALITVVIPA